MKKIVAAVCTALMLVCMFSGCGQKRGQATPGALVVPTHTPIVGKNETPASEDVNSAICNVTWMDTDSFDLYTLAEDGGLTVIRDTDKKTENGKWILMTDEEGFLSLHLDLENSEDMVLYELELYETSIFAVSENGEAYIWLMQD